MLKGAEVPKFGMLSASCISSGQARNGPLAASHDGRREEESVLYAPPFQEPILASPQPACRGFRSRIWVARSFCTIGWLLSRQFHFAAGWSTTASFKINRCICIC